MVDLGGTPPKFSRFRGNFRGKNCKLQLGVGGPYAGNPAPPLFNVSQKSGQMNQVCTLLYGSRSSQQLTLNQIGHKVIHHNCSGAMNNKDLGLWCRRGLLAYVYTGVTY